jgi:carboxymethylenebutenolidase
MLVSEDAPVDLATPTGPMRTYVYRPSVTPAPGVVLYSEIYQRTAPVHRMALMLAGHGFLVALPEIFHAHEAPGSVLAYDDAGTARGNALKAITTPTAHDGDARAVLDFLAASPHCTGALGAMGVCIGGHLAYRAALQPDVRATACFYATNLHDASLGGGDDSLARAGEIRGELLMIWGRQDPHIPEAGRAAIRARLPNARWIEHDAQHAFMRDEGKRYDPALALASYATVVELFRATLR